MFLMVGMVRAKDRSRAVELEVGRDREEEQVGLDKW